MTTADVSADLDQLWATLPRLLEEDEGWAVRAVLAAGVHAYTREPETPEGLMIRHNPDGTRELVGINFDGQDTVIRSL